MMNEITVMFKNVVLKGYAGDEKADFTVESSGDLKITADPTTVLAMAEYLEEVLKHEA